MDQPFPSDKRILPKSRVDDLIGLLAGDGYEVIGPHVEQGAIVYAPLRSAQDLPVGWTDRQAPGTYRLEKRTDQAYFGYAVGPHSWKKYLFPPALLLWQGQRTSAGFTVHDEEPDPPRRAFLGMRPASCTPWPCRISSLSIETADSRTLTTPRRANACSSSRLSASIPPELAFAHRWAPGQRCGPSVSLCLRRNTRRAPGKQKSRARPRFRCRWQHRKTAQGRLTSLHATS